MRSRFGLPGAVFCSGTFIPARRARNSTASGKLRFSISIMKFITLPPLPQPKQWYICFEGDTENDGVFSLWKGQSPNRFWPLRLVRATYSPTTSSMGFRSASSCKKS